MQHSLPSSFSSSAAILKVNALSWPSVLENRNGAKKNDFIRAIVVVTNPERLL
jgi:hypothetical protein